MAKGQAITLLERISHQKMASRSQRTCSKGLAAPSHEFILEKIGNTFIKHVEDLHPDDQPHTDKLENNTSMRQQLSHLLHAFHDPERHKNCSVAVLSASDRVDNWDGDLAPFSYQPMSVSAAMWPFVLAAFAWGSTDLIHSGYTCVAWAMLAYESYIIFDHLPFLFTNHLYSSARINFEHTDLTAFWGMEAASTVISYVAIGSPWWVMGNIPNHASFIFFNYCKRIATSETFQFGRKRWYLVVGVAFDTSLHCVSALFYIKYLCGDVVACSWQTWGLWMVLNAAMVLLTVWVHYDFMHWGHFLVHFGLRPAPELS